MERKHIGAWLCLFLIATAAAQSVPPAPYQGATIAPSPPSPYQGSVPEPQPTPGVLRLSLQDAIERGMRQNLGVLLASDSTIAARGERWRQLSELLPNLTTATSESLQQESLAARGIRAPGLPGVVGPFGVFDTRAYLTQSLFSLKSIEKERAAAESLRAARFSYQDARDLVVLAVGNAYLQILASAARQETAEAQVKTAQALYDRALDQQKSGVSPAIDTLRARVELQSRQQELIVARNNLAKNKLALARIIGLALGQEFEASESFPYEPLAAISVDEALQRAYRGRADYQSALSQARAAELSRKAAKAGYLPSLGMNFDVGDIGANLGNSHGTFHLAGTLRFPVFEGGKVHGEVLEADAALRESREKLADLRGRIDYDVRTAFLDLAAAAEQVEVAKSSVLLANQTLEQAQDRFTHGVSDNLEVVQAQESVATANEAYISSLYAHNLAKIQLARALGVAQSSVQDFLRGK